MYVPRRNAAVSCSALRDNSRKCTCLRARHVHLSIMVWYNRAWEHQIGNQAHPGRRTSPHARHLHLSIMLENQRLPEPTRGIRRTQGEDFSPLSGGAPAALALDQVLQPHHAHQRIQPCI